MLDSRPSPSRRRLGEAAGHQVDPEPGGECRRPGDRRTSRVSAPARSTSGVPATEKYSGSTTSVGSGRRRLLDQVARRRHGWRPGRSPAVVWMAAARMSQGRSGIGHNDRRRQAPRPVPPRGRERRVLRRLRCRPQCRPGGGIPRRRVQLPAIRALGMADYGGSSVGECLAVVAEITDGSPRSWTRGFEHLARRVEGRGPGLPGRRPAGERAGPSAAGVHLLPHRRVLRGVARPPRGRGARSRACFSEAAALVDPPVEPLDIPFAGGSLPGYLVRPRSDAGPVVDGRRRPTVVGRGRVRLERRGAVLPARGARRRAGWNVVVFDGPGTAGAACARSRP